MKILGETKQITAQTQIKLDYTLRTAVRVERTSSKTQRTNISYEDAVKQVYPNKRPSFVP
jgi:hypothetical protein